VPFIVFLAGKSGILYNLECNMVTRSRQFLVLKVIQCSVLGLRCAHL